MADRSLRFLSFPIFRTDWAGDCGDRLHRVWYPTLSLDGGGRLDCDVCPVNSRRSLAIGRRDKKLLLHGINQRGQTLNPNFQSVSGLNWSNAAGSARQDDI